LGTRFGDQGLVPGAFVRHPGESGWGLGQVQSVVGNRVTVNFENRGKVIILSEKVTLEIVDPSAEQTR
jgi:transcription elongation factor GreA-like protein